MPPPYLSAEQKALCAQLRAWVDSKDATEIVQKNRDWCTDACVRRYTIASGFKVEKAKKMLTATLKWRAEQRPDLFEEKDFKNCAVTKFMYWNGFDQHGHPILYFHSRFHDISIDRTERINYALFTLEKGIMLMDKKFSGKEDIEQWVIVLDEANRTSKNTDSKLLRKVAPVMFEHYVERLYRCFVIRPTPTFAVLVKLVSLFIDEKTKSKLMLSKKDNEKVKQKEAEVVDTEKAIEDIEKSTTSPTGSNTTPVTSPIEIPINDLQTTFPELVMDVGLPHLQVSFGGKHPDWESPAKYHNWIFNEVKL